MGLEARFSSQHSEATGSVEPSRMKTVVVAGTSSGVGKTTIAVGLMAAFSRRGLRVQPFKVGPDFLDPMHHKAATGRESLNLDGWMLCRDVNLSCFMRCQEITDIAIVEGVMGLYDGRDGKSEVGSTAEMAKMLGAPVVLVLDCWALARSAAAMVHGYTTFDKDLEFAGVVFNKVGGPAHTTWLSEAVLATKQGVRILGGVPKSANIEIPERHLGLHMPEDDTLPQNYINRLADLVELYIDLDAILEAAAMCNPVDAGGQSFTSIMIPPVMPKQVRIGVARDAAFCFYYYENLALLQDAGAELVYFSPIEDALPPSLDGIYFGGGYPELHARRLSSNKAMLYAVKAFADAGGVVYGECGGLMYLAQGIEGRDGERHTMSGVFPFWTRMQAAMHMGYVKVRPRESCPLFPPEIGEIRGQMYHFSEIVQGEVDTSLKGLVIKFESTNTAEELEGYMQGNTLATYVHLHFGSNPAVAHSLVECCRMDPIKAAAVAAASASAVADAGPAAAAAAGAAAAAAVAAALSESIELAPFHSSDMAMYILQDDPLGNGFGFQESSHHPTSIEEMLPTSPTSNISNMKFKSSSEEQVSKLRKSKAMLRRWSSFDLAMNGRSSSPRKLNGRLIKSESELSFAGSLNSRHKLSVARALSFSSENGSHDSSLESSSIEASGGEQCVHQATEGSHLQSCNKYRSVDSESQQDACTQDGSLQQRAATDTSAALGTPKITFEKEAFLASRFSGYRGPCTNIDVPQRILSLLPSATEILMDLGVGSRLLGVTDLCDKPAGVQTNRHIVCRSKIDTSKMSSREVEAAMRTFAADKESLFTLDESWISSVQPDLVLTQDTCEQCDVDSSEVARTLSRAGLSNKRNTTVIVMRPCTVSDVLSSILELGRAVGLYEEASLKVQGLRARLRRVVGAVASRTRPRVMLLQGLDPLCLGGHWVPEMESLAGGQDDLQRPGCSAERLYWPRIIAYAPEVLVLAPCSSSLERTLSEVWILASQPGFWTLPAVESRQLYICEHSYFSRPSAAIVDGVELLGHIFHPTCGVSSKLKSAAMKLSLRTGRKCKPHDLAKHFVALE